MTFTIIAILSDGNLNLFHYQTDSIDTAMYLSLKDLGKEYIMSPDSYMKDIYITYEIYFLEKGEIDSYKITQINVSAKTI
jgi:hypothetical protein